MHRRPLIAFLIALAALLVAAGGAQAVVVNDQGTTAGVALVPGTATSLAIQAPATPCDPWLSSDLAFPTPSSSQPLCWHGGPVMHANETFTLTWDPHRSYWQTTRQYVEQFLSNVAGASGTMSSPYAITSQYVGSNGRAYNASLFGGGCIDYGATGGYTCKFGDTTGSGLGDDYPAATATGCTATGTNQYFELADGGYGDAPNRDCITDAQIQTELQSVIPRSGLLDHVKAGYTPLVVVLTPAGVEDCLDSGGNLCSANSAASSQFCSYHSQVEVAGTEVAYLVQPWTVGWDSSSPCDEPDAQPSMPTPKDPPPDPDTLATAVGARLVSPLSRSQIAAIVNPGLDSWFTPSGAEIDDNGCVPLGHQDDQASLGATAYFLQREFNNAGVLQIDPNGPVCAPSVILSPAFVVPSAVNAGDVVQLDGSATASTLIVPKGDYFWSFGDGATAVGPSVTHVYTKGGTYIIRLAVLDRGDYAANLAETITVLSPKGKPVTSTPAHGSAAALKAHLTLMPQSLHSALHRGVTVAVSANETADGIATLAISKGAASRARIKHGRGATVVIGRGTVSGVKAGTVKLHLHLPHGIASRLARLRHLTLTVRLTLVAAGGAHVAIDAAGRY